MKRLLSILLVVAFLMVSTHIVITPTESMEPTIERWHFYRCRRFVGPDDVQRGDIITYRTGFTQYLKRVIGLPGDEVIICEGVVYLNRSPLPGPYTSGCGCWVVGEGEMFVLGDNREISYDSRYTAELPKLKAVTSILYR